MGTGALFVRFFYPGHFGLVVPSDYALQVEGSLAHVRLLRRLSPVEVLDFTNELIPDPERRNFRRLKRPIESPSEKSFELAMSIITEQQDITLHNLSMERITALPHRLTLERTSLEEYKFYKTRDWTDILIIYEIEDTLSISPPESIYFQKVLNQFIQIYRLITKDSRIRYWEDIQEAISWNLGKVEFSDEDSNKSPHERLGTTREVIFKDETISFPYARERTFEFDISVATQQVSEFASTNRTVSLALELFLRAHEAAYYRRNFRYALLEAFTAVEVCVSRFLNTAMISRGVSKGKLEEYESEVSMAYKLNIELPLLLNNINNKEREVIGSVDKLRKLRNAVIHTGRPVSEVEAKESVRVTGALFDMLVSRGSEV
jgi:hypothetical protein